MPHKKNSKVAWFIWGLAASFFFAEYFARVAPSIMTQELMATFKVSGYSLGVLSALFYYPYIAMQIPVGVLVDRYGPHKLLTLMALLFGIACLLFAHASNLWLAGSARFLMGLTGAFAFVGALKLAKNWFDAKHFGFLAGSTQALGMLGAAIGEGPISALVATVGWRYTMNIIGLALLLIGVLIGLFVRNRPIETKAPELQPTAKAQKQFSLFGGLVAVLKIPQVWINGAIVGFLYAPTASFAELWGPSYINGVYHISMEKAATAMTMIFLGWAIGGPLAGKISDKIQRRKPIIIASIIGSFLALSIALYAPGLSVTSLFILMFCYGLFNVGVATCYAVASEVVPASISGTSMSFANMASVIIGALFQPVIGKLLDLNWDGKMLHGARIYSATNYHTAMTALPLCLIVSLFFSFLLKESFGQHSAS